MNWESNITQEGDMKNITKKMQRRCLMSGVGGGALLALSRRVLTVAGERGSEEKPGAGEVLRLRPHHILDIVTSYGAGERFEPHPYGHSLHIVAKTVLADSRLKTELVAAADAVCHGCRHLQRDGRCDDVLSQLDPAPSKQAYNEVIDCRLLDDLRIKPGAVMMLREYLALVNQRVPGIEKICTHPKEDERQRLASLTAGLVKLDVRQR
jgi:hypothetical protein